MPAGMRGREGNMKKKLLGLVACVATLALSGALLAGCSGSGDKTGGDSADGKETLTVGFDQSYPPYGFVAQGNINCIWNGFTMEGREDGYTFSDPYMLNEQVIVVKAGSDISDFAGLSGKTVMTQVDSAALDVLEGDQAEVAATFKGGAAQTIGDYNNAFMQLDSGMIDAVACDLSIAQYQIAANPDKYVQLSTPLSTEHYAVGFKKGDTELAQKVTETLKQLDADGTVKRLCEKYASYGISYDNWVLGK